MKSRIAIFPVTVDNALDILEITEQYKDLLNFEETCSYLSRSVTTTVFSSWKSSTDVLGFWNKNKEKMELINILFKNCLFFANSIFVPAVTKISSTSVHFK